MALIRQAVSAIVRAPLTSRPPLRAGGGVVSALSSGIGASRNLRQQMDSYTAIGWLFSVVSRIAASVAATDWQLFAGEREVSSHPLLQLWNRPNPYYTRWEFLETAQQHLELTGETWWLMLRGPRGEPKEIWPVRPDRMTVVPSRKQYIAGYIYRIGNERIPLEPDDVLYLRMPSPTDPYRGAGPVQAIFADLESESLSTQWGRNFFRNSAEPGGVIELADTLTDADWEKFTQRWREQHGGVANAHRVAVLEKGVWKDRRYTQRDMEFSALRRLNRDIILGAFGMPAAMLGISENVNRANAEAAEAMYGRWVIRPRLQRIVGALNEMLVPRFGGNLRFAFTDPTPDNRELDLDEAERGYKAGILTLNEARARLDEGEVPDGETFAPIMPAGLSVSLPANGSGPTWKAAEPGPAPYENLPVDVLAALRAVERAWAKRLAGEADALAGYVLRFAEPVVRGKLGAGDLDGYDWDWLAKYGDAVAVELAEAFRASMTQAGPLPAPGELEIIAQRYARERTQRILALDGEHSLPRASRQRVNTLVAQNLESGDSIQRLARNIRTDFMFSRGRAVNIARTETATALGRAGKELALINQQDEKRWVTQGDDHVDELCLAAEADGWIGVHQAFAGGYDTVPAHPACLVGGSRIAAQGVTATMKRWYEGRVVVLSTRLGHHLTCTPNHPILTDHGWVPASVLHEGDYVISSLDAKWRGSGNPDDQDMPACIEEIACAFGQPGSVTAIEMPVASKDFHGDGIGSKVAVVRAYGLLSNRVKALANEHLGEPWFPYGDIGRPGLSGPGLCGLGLKRHDAPAASLVSSRNLIGAGSRTHARPLQALRGATAPVLDTSLSDDAGDGASAYPVPTGEQLHRIAGQVFADELVSVRWRPFAGHVYNLETVDGFYVAETIVTHNCRCTNIYRTAELHGERAVRCPQCNKRQPVSNVRGAADLFCVRCRHKWSLDNRTAASVA